MLFAKNVREWFAFFGGEELGINLEHASIVWDAAIKSIKRKSCSWKLDIDDCYYETSCGKTWYFPEGDIKDNDVKFCPHCGGKVKSSKC